MKLLRWLLLAAALVLLGCTINWWPHVRNEFFVLIGSRNEPGGWYGFHSGFGGSYYIALFALGPLWWYQRSCHAHPWCLRWGKYEAAGGMFKLCWLHHPDLQGARPHLELIHRLHREHQARR